MQSQENYAHKKFGIDEIYIHEGFSYDLLEKLHQRALLTLDNSDIIVRQRATHDMILIFHYRVPSKSLIYRFLEHFDKDTNKENYIKANTLINEEELFVAIKSKKYILVTHRFVSME